MTIAVEREASGHQERTIPHSMHGPLTSSTAVLQVYDRAIPALLTWARVIGFLFLFWSITIMEKFTLNLNLKSSNKDYDVKPAVNSTQSSMCFLSKSQTEFNPGST